MMASETKQAALDTATAAAVDLLGFEYNTIRERDAEQGTLVPVASSPALRERDGERRTYDRGETVQWHALNIGEMLVYQSVADINDGADRAGDGSMIVVPLDEYGVLTLGSPEPQDIADSDAEIARIFGANLEAAIGRIERLEALKDREHRLERQNEKLQRLSGMVAHEFRNPLNVVSGHLEMVEGAPGDDRHVDAARRATERMDRLTSSLLELVREEEPDPESVSVERVATAVFDEVAPEGAELSVVDDVTIAADPARLRTVLENVVGNAVRHGGESVHVRVGALSEGGFYVADDGTGFDGGPEDPFGYEVTSGDEGAGLGLAIVRDIAMAHEWRVGARESNAGGARVEFRTDPS